MWLPGRVQSRHKKRAYFIWGGLVGVFVGYAAWVVLSALKARKHPSISVTLELARYTFPDVSICFDQGMGCDTDGIVECTASPLGEDGYAHDAFALGIHGFVVEDGQSHRKVEAIESEYFSNCLEFPLSELEFRSDINDLGVEPLVSLRLRWVTAEDVDDDDALPQFYSKVVEVFFIEGGQPLLNETPGLQFPYNRFNNNEPLVTATVTSMNMELTETKYLSGRTEKLYGASSLVQFEYEYTDNGWTVSNDDELHGLLLLEIRQPKLSHTILEQNDPLQPATIIGSIGGTWELILIVWGILFIANTRQQPDLKGRNFFKSARKVLNLGGSISRRSSEISSRRTENLPSWDCQANIEASARRSSPMRKGMVPAFSAGSLKTDSESKSGRNLDPSIRRPVALGRPVFPSLESGPPERPTLATRIVPHS